MTHKRWDQASRLLEVAVALMLFAPVLTAAEKRTTLDFLRFVNEGAWEGRVETAVVTYVDQHGVEVSLVAAVHCADRSYYEALQKKLEEYEVVLCEGVPAAVEKGAEGKGEGSKDASGGRQDKAVWSPEGLETWARFFGDLEAWAWRHFQTQVLGFEVQWEQIDYSKQNFVGADMDDEKFWRLVKERGENREEFWGLVKFLDVYLRDVQQRLGFEVMRGKVTGKERLLRDTLELLTGLLGADRARLVKFLVARESMRAVALEDRPGGGETVVIHERDKIAMTVLRQQIQTGKKKLAIFYGAAHIPDLEQRLSELGVRQIKQEWLTAWDIRRK